MKAGDYVRVVAETWRCGMRVTPGVAGYFRAILQGDILKVDHVDGNDIGYYGTDWSEYIPKRKLEYIPISFVEKRDPPQTTPWWTVAAVVASATPILLLPRKTTMEMLHNETVQRGLAVFTLAVLGLIAANGGLLTLSHAGKRLAAWGDRRRRIRRERQVVEDARTEATRVRNEAGYAKLQKENDERRRAEKDEEANRIKSLVDRVKGLVTPADTIPANLTFQPGAIVEWVKPTECGAQFQKTANEPTRHATTGDRTVITELVGNTARYRIACGSSWGVNLSELKVIG